MIDPTKTYVTREKRLPVRIYAVDSGGLCPVHGAYFYGGMWFAVTWNVAGVFNAGTNRDLDLIEVKPPVVLFVGVSAKDCGRLSSYTSSENRCNLGNYPYLIRLELDVEANTVKATLERKPG